MKTTNNDQELAEALGIDTPNVPAPYVPKPLLPRPIEANVASDADYARNNAIEIIEKGSEALDQAMELARESAHPRMYEVLGQLLKIQSDNVDKLLKIHQDKLKLNSNTPQQQQTITCNVFIDKAVFTGTTTQLLEMMRTNEKNQTTESDDVDD